jgi:S1-C subfamily serine protease
MLWRIALLPIALSFSFFLTAQPSVASSLPSAAVALAAAAATATSTPIDTSVTSSPAAQSNALSRTDLIGLTQPAIVRIITHFEGTTTIPAFDVNLETLTWTLKAKAPDAVPYDTDLAGSGFIVNSDGYIVTNSHVVTGTAFRMKIAAQLAGLIALGKAQSLTAKENAKLNALGYTAAQYEKLVFDGVSFITAHLPPMLPTSITVLKPGAPLAATTTSAYTTQLQNATSGELEKQIADLIQAGVPATVVAQNDRYQDDEKDLALLKVQEVGLPAINLGSDGAIQEGSPIYVFGFPSSADITMINGQPSFTPGAVNALKDSTQHTFKYIQTDAKVSPGSSGGPMLDATGAAVGVVTLQSANASGDSFAFAIPVALVQQMLASSSVPVSVPSDYTRHFLAGLALEEAKHCKAATDEFSAAETANPVFGSVVKYVHPHIDSCAALIASGQSIDSSWDAVRVWIEQQGLLFWGAIAGGVLLAILFIVLITLLIKRMRKDEVAISTIKDDHPLGVVTALPTAGPDVISASPTSAPSVQPVTAAPTQPTPKNPEIVLYIQHARQSGQTDDQIKAALHGVGWGDDAIEESFKS